MSCDLCKKEVEKVEEKEKNIPKEITCLDCGTIWLRLRFQFVPISPVDHLEVEEIKGESPSNLTRF